MILSNGERAVWAAEYVRARDLCEREHGPLGWNNPPSGEELGKQIQIAEDDAVVAGIIAAFVAVEELRNGLALMVARPNPGAGAIAAIDMLRDVLGEE